MGNPVNHRVPRRLIISLPAAAALLSACSGGGSSTTSSKPGTFVVFSGDAANMAAQQEMLQADFGTPNNVTVQVIAYPATEFLAQFQNAVRSSSQIDGLIVNGQHVGFLQSKGLLSPVDDIVDTASLQPSALDPFKIGDKLYAAGVGTLNTSMMAYNPDIMKKYDLVVPKIFEDIKANVAKLDGTGVSLIGFGGATVFQWPMWYMQMLQQTSADEPTDLTKATLAGKAPDFTGQPYVEAMRLLQQLGASGAFAPGMIGTANTAAQADFLAGKSAMYWYGSWVISSFIQQAKFEVQITPFPSFVSGVTPRPVGGVTGATALYNKVSSDNAELAKKFVQFLTSPEGDEKMMKVAPQGFQLPANKNVQMPSQTPVEKRVTTEFIPKTFGFLDWLWPAAVTTAFQQNIQAVVGQQKSPEDAMRDIQAAYQAGG